jgi:protein-disulfide isomerase
LVTAAERAPGPTKGRENAPITIVEFSDFQCSYCRKFWRDTLPKLETEYINSGRVRFIFRNFVALGPLSEHAAEAAQCAWEQGKFWGYHDALFESAGRLPAGPALLERLRLDSTAFEACLVSGRHKERILVESAIARRLGASGTPAFLIKGKLLIGAHPFETFQQILDTLAKELSVPATVDPAVPSRQ